jgi:Flp pilus assembly protein TadG
MRNENGTALVEAAIVLPVMVLVIIGGLDLGLGMLAATRLNFATESAAKCGALVVVCSDDIATKAFAATQSNAPASAFSIIQTPGMEQVSASWAYSFSFLPWTVTLRSSASYPTTNW